MGEAMALKHRGTGFNPHLNFGHIFKQIRQIQKTVFRENSNDEHMWEEIQGTLAENNKLKL